MRDQGDSLLEQILAGASGDHEQLAAFEQAFGSSARFPFPARVVGVAVHVTSVVYEGEGRRGLVAVCRRGDERHCVSLVDVIPGPVTVATARLLGAYRQWCGLVPTPGANAPSQAWAYRLLAGRPTELAAPLGLKPEGDWDPAEEYWGEPGEPPHRVISEILAAGVRPAFEMEQVIPGVVDDDWDSDPVSEAAELHRGGFHVRAIRILEGLITQDERCIDAWVHLGNIAFDRAGPKAALEPYETAVAVGEASIGEGFAGVLPWGLIDNRPFHRALYGLGLCAWRQRRWQDAEAVFTARVWLDGGAGGNALSCLDSVSARQRWRKQ